MEIKTKADAIAFFATPDACVPCQMVGAYCGGSGANCYDTLAAMSVYANADLAERIERNSTKPYPKGHDAVPDLAASPYPCGREAMHEAGACECHGYHP